MNSTSKWLSRLPWARLARLESNQERIMALLDDLKTAVATESADEAKLIAVLEATLASNKDLAAKLAAAIAANDPTALQPILDTVAANNTAMEAELAKTAPPAPAPAPAPGP
jgi:hypothetical protein